MQKRRGRAEQDVENAAGFRRAATADKLGWPGRVAITLEIDVNGLSRYADAYLAALWHAAQAAPAPYGDKLAGDVVQKLTFEIVRRWLATAPAEIYHHQAGADDTAVRMAFARYRPGGADDRDGMFHDGAWMVRGEVIDAVLAGPPEGTRCPCCGSDGTLDDSLRLPSSSRRMDTALDRGAAGLARVEYGPGAGEVWICRDSEACRTRVWRAAEADDSLVCAKCNRMPGLAAAPAELDAVETGDGPRWVCTDTDRCDRRVGAGARLPYRFDAQAQTRVAAVRAENEASTDQAAAAGDDDGARS